MTMVEAWVLAIIDDGGGIGGDKGARAGIGDHSGRGGDGGDRIHYKAGNNQMGQVLGSRDCRLGSR